jgi:hypothetical protein
MSIEITDAQNAVFQEELLPALESSLDELPDDPAEVERLAVLLVLPMELPEVPADVRAAVLDAIEQRRDPGAAGLLAAIAVLGREPLACQARAASERLASGGIVSPISRQLGTLAVQEAARFADGSAEMLVAALRRPRARDAQVAIFAIEHEDTRGSLVECILTSPMQAAEARGYVTGEATAPGAPAPEAMTTDELVACACAAAERAVDAGVALGHEASVALPILSRALTGDPARMARPDAVPPWEEDDEELFVDPVEDEEGFHRTVQQLVEEFDEHVAEEYPEGAIARNGAFVAGSLLDWKGGYADGRLGRWSATDLSDYLLDFFPRKLSLPLDELDDVPECVVAFVFFLAARGSLSGDAPHQLEQACDELRGEFGERARSPERWGVAKSLVMLMLADGVDLDEPGALEAWMADFNARPSAERDGAIGAAAGDPREPTQRSRGGAPRNGRARRADRKAQRAARRRNRGR